MEIKGFKVTSNNQYKQDISFPAGEYTYSAHVWADGDTYAFTVKGESGTLYDFDLSNQIVYNNWQRVRKTFTVPERIVELSSLSNGSGEGRTYYIVAPMIEEGSNMGTPKPHELDIEELAERDDSISINLGIPYYEFKKDDSGIIAETIQVPFYVYRDNQRVNIPSSQISVAYKTTGIDVLDVVGANNTVYVIATPSLTANEGRVVFEIPVDGKYYDVEFNFKVKPSKDGKDGESNIISDLDNENQSIAVSEDGSYLFGLPITTKFTIYSGATEVALDSLSVQSIAGVSSSTNRSTGVVTVTSIAKSVPDKVDIKITGKATVNGVQYTRESYLTINKVKKGEKGDSPILYELQPSVSQIRKLTDGTLIPSTISCRMIATSASGSSSTTTLPFHLSAQRSLDNGETWSNYTLGTSINTSLINTSVQFRLYQETAPITMLDIETIMIVEDGEQGKDGESSIIADLDNENQSISVDTDGTYMFGLPISTKFSIYAGATSLVLDSLAVQSISGVTATAVKETGIVTVTAVAKTVPDKIDLKITGKATVNSIQYTREAYLTINKIKKGESGDSPVLYELQPSVSQIKKLSNGTFTPASISCRLLVTDVNGSYATTTKPYSLSVEYSLNNGDTWSSYSLGSSINTSLISNSIQFRLYQDTSPVTMLDIETIMVVEDGKDGDDGDDGAGGFFIDISATNFNIKGNNLSNTNLTISVGEGDKLYYPNNNNAEGNFPNRFFGVFIEERVGVGTPTIQLADGTTMEVGNIPSMSNDEGYIVLKITGCTIGGVQFTKYRRIEYKKILDAKWIKLNATSTQIKQDQQNNYAPATISVFAQLFNMSGTATWSYSVNGGSFVSTLPTGVSRSGNQVTINSSTSTFLVLTVKASMSGVEDTITITRVKDGQDGQRGLPGKMPVTKEFRVGQTYYNNDTAVHYIYYRDTNTWWKLKDGVSNFVAQATPPSDALNLNNFEQLSSVEVMVAETVIAENANIAGFIFREELLVSQMGRSTAGDDLVLGDYMQFQFAQGAFLSIAPTTGWADTPPTSSVTYLWMRMKLKSNTEWMVNYRISGSNPHVGVRFGATKDGDFYDIPYQSGRDWIEVTYDAGTQNEQVKIYPITEELAISDFKPNLQIDGRNGYIYATRGEFEGVVKADSGSIGKWEIIGESITSPNKRLILDSLSNAMSMLDEYGATKVLIKPEPILSLNDYFTGGNGVSINISSLIRSYGNPGSSSASSPIVSISTSGGKIYEAIIPAFTINVNVDVTPMGGGTTQPMGVLANLRVYFRTSFTTKVEIGRASVMSVGGFEAETVQVASSTRAITNDGDYSLQVVLEVVNPSGQIVTASGTFSSDITTIPISQIVNRSEIGTNGMVIATSPTSYTYMGGSEFATRKGNYGIRITSGGIQKMTNGSTWEPANI